MSRINLLTYPSIGLKKIFFIVPAFLFIFSSSCAHASEAVKPVFDDRTWELGWSDDNKSSKGPQKIFDEYVLKGETVENWSELVTIQFFPGLNTKTNLDIFESALKGRLLTVCPTTVWDSFEQQKDERSWQFTIKDCQGQPDQSELARAIKTSDGIYVFHYAIKKSPMPQDLRKTWIKNLKAVKVNE